MIVVDASVIVPALADDGTTGEQARSRLLDERLVAPELLDLEVAAAWRRLVTSGNMIEGRAELALVDLRRLEVRRVPHRYLIGRCWELRQNLTIYDAAYVALAEALDTVLVTADARLAGAPGCDCEVELLE